MKTLTLFLIACRLNAAEINGSLTLARITTPSAPATSFSTISVNSTTGVIGCINADSTNCFNSNASGAIAPTLPATTNFYVIGAAASNSRILGVAYAGTSFVTNARYDGTPASLTAIQSGEQIAGYNAFGYNGTSLGGPAASLRIFANQNWTNAAQGSYIDFTTTANGSTTAVAAGRIENDGGLTWPSTVTGGDKGVGTINATGLFVNGTAVSTSTGTVTSIATNNGITGGTITSTGTIGLASVSANTVLGALTATNPSGLAVPSCSTGSSAIIWTSGTGFGCNTGFITGLTINATTISGGGTNAILSGDGTKLQNNTGVTSTATGTLTFSTSVISPLYTASAALAIQPGADSTTGLLIKAFAGPTLVGFDTTSGRVTLGPSCATGSNTLFIENCVATTGSTSVVIKGGAGNATSDILLNIQNNGGTSEFSVTDAGAVTMAGQVTVSSGMVVGASGISATGNNLLLADNGESVASTFPLSIGFGTYTQTSGSNGIVKITGTYNQASGTAANTDLLINRTQTAVGSGAQLLIDAQVSTVSKFKVDNTGATTTVNITVSGQPATTGQRFACLTTTGQIVSSATACVGT